MRKIPATRAKLTLVSGTPSRPKWSITRVTSIWPAIIKLNVIATPSLGTSVTAAATKKAPSRPPIHENGAATYTDAKLPSGDPEIVR